MPDPVALVRCQDDYAPSLKRGLDLLGGLNMDGHPVMIKPNLCIARDSSGGTVTRSASVKAVIDAVLEQAPSVSIFVVESDSDGKWLDEAYEDLGYVKMADDYHDAGYDVRLVNLSREPVVKVSSTYFSEPLWLPRMLLEPNYLVSIAKAKTHTLTDITGALKNQFGCIPRKDKAVYHRSIDEVIVEVNCHISPSLCIIDAVTGQEGVIRGRLREIGILILGRRPSSVDSVLAQVMGIDPETVRHLALAGRAGLGSLDPPLVGVPVEEVAIKFRRPSRIAQRAGRGMPLSLYSAFRDLYKRFR